MHDVSYSGWNISRPNWTAPKGPRTQWQAFRRRSTANEESGIGTLPSMRRYGQGCALVAIAFLTAESRLQAYIDPGTTGLFLQGRIGDIAAVIVLTGPGSSAFSHAPAASPHHDAPCRGAAPGRLDSDCREA